MRYLTREDLTLELPRWSGLLEQVAQEKRHVGLGPDMGSTGFFDCLIFLCFFEVIFFRYLDRED